jgi:hypothetical protein
MKSLLLVFPLLLSACGPVGRGWEAGWTERAAQDRIMLVRNAPETLGHRRLVYQSTAHPNLDVFLKEKGLPDFIEEGLRLPHPPRDRNGYRFRRALFDDGPGNEGAAGAARGQRAARLRIFS